MMQVLEPGPLSTVQDAGRFGQLRFGIPPSGAIDRFAFVVANRLVGNREDAAVLECTLVGPTLVFESACTVAVTGAEMPVRRNGAEASRWATLRVQPGDVLKLGTARAGLRAYIAVSGGIDVPPVLGSRSTYLRGKLGGLSGRALQKADRLGVLPGAEVRAWRLALRALPTYPAEVSVRVVLGPQHERFTAEGIEQFLLGTYVMLPQSDRMGARLSGPRIGHARGHDIVSDGIALGAVQVPGDGQPIVLLNDRQSTGGYTKAATVCSFDIGRVGQLRPGQRLHFEAVTIGEAHAMLRASAHAMAQLPQEAIE